MQAALWPSYRRISMSMALSIITVFELSGLSSIFTARTRYSSISPSSCILWTLMASRTALPKNDSLMASGTALPEQPCCGKESSGAPSEVRSQNSFVPSRYHNHKDLIPSTKDIVVTSDQGAPRRTIDRRLMAIVQRSG